MAKPTVIIPVYNQAALTAQCLHSILGHVPCQVRVVDDASTDATPGVLAGFGEQIEVITHTRNLGFAASCNDGANRATGDYLVFLNNDTVPKPGWLGALVRYAGEHPEAAAVGSKLLYPDGTLQHAGVVVCQDKYPRHIYCGFPAGHPAVNKSRRFQIVTAACMLVRRKVFEAANGFDTAFRNGFEDVDFCLRLGERGLQVHYCAESVVEHFESVSPGRFHHDRGNVALYRQRWMGRVLPDDLDYYLQDGLLRLEYEGRYPIIIECSPRLGTVDGAARTADLESLLREQGRQLADLQRENTRLRLDLGGRTPRSLETNYQLLRERIRQIVQGLVPAGATLLVTTRGDGALLEFPGRRAWHFPQTERGAYAGHHPENGAAAVVALENLRAKGAGYLLVPATSLWWLDFYREFRQHLEAHYTRLAAPNDICAIYRLARSGRLPELPGEIAIEEADSPASSHFREAAQNTEGSGA